MILIIVLGCDWKVSVGHIQTGSKDLLPLQAWGRLWQGLCLGVHYCWRQSIVLLDLTLLSSSSQNNPFVDFYLCILNLLNHNLFTLKFFLNWYFKLSVGYKQTRYMDFSPPQACVRSWRGPRFCDCTCNHQSFGFFQSNDINIFLFILVSICLAVE